MKKGWILATAVAIVCLGCAPAKAILNQRLIDACSTGNYDAAKSALDQGADPNAVDPDPDRGFTALGLASESPQIVAILLKAGASPRKPDKNGLIPLGLAAGLGDVSTMERLIKAGARIDDKDSNGIAPLEDAAMSGKLDNAMYLVACGAKVNAADNLGQTALMSAATRAAASSSKKDTVEVVRLLVSNGADLTAKDNKGLNALAHAQWVYKAWKGKIKTDPVLIDLLTPKTAKPAPSKPKP